MKKSYFIILLLYISSCSLEEEILDEYQMNYVFQEDSVGLNFITPSYAKLHSLFTNEQGIYLLNEGCSDEFMVPSNNFWDIAFIELLKHQWGVNNQKITGTWLDLDHSVGLANAGIQLINDLEDSEIHRGYIDELRFLRTFYRFWQLDFFRQVPMRDEMDLNFVKAPDVWTGIEAMEWLISELNEIIPGMKDNTEIKYGRASKTAAQFLLAKIYLNAEVYAQTPKYSECLGICNEILESSKYGFSQDYFDIFSADNDLNNEHIFTITRDRSQGLAWFSFNPVMTLAYEQGGWNMSCAVPDFVKIWDQDNDSANGITSTDLRFFDPKSIPQTGYNYGLLIGQQYFPDGSEIPGLNYSIDFELPANYSDGVRVVKYEKDLLSSNPYGYFNNNFVIFRYSDVVLMAAEAKFRLGQESDALTDINSLRLTRNAPLLTSISEQDILNERAFELYWEGWRRQDLIRFNQFTRAWGHKEKSEDYREVFPIPDIAFHSNPNLVQNPGY